jgi:hypothetical protein
MNAPHAYLHMHVNEGLVSALNPPPHLGCDRNQRRRRAGGLVLRMCADHASTVHAAHACAADDDTMFEAALLHGHLQACTDYILL